MKLIRVPTLLALILLLTMTFGGILRPIFAQVLSLQQLDIDDSQVQPDDAYSVPTSIVIIPIFAPSSDFSVRDRDWFRGLHYFLTAGQNRAGFTDIPFHYVISRDGRIFKGNSGGEERKISIEGLGDQQVVIGYLAGKSDTSFDARSEAVVAELAVTVASRHSIKLTKISATGVDYIRDDQTQTVSLRNKELFGLWGTTLKKAVNNSKFLYVPGTKQYSLKVVDVSLPSEKASYDQEVTGTISIQNTGEFGVYGDTVSEIIATKVKGNSKFYNRNTWVSTSQFSIMEPSDTIRPGEQVDLSFTLKIPLIWGTRTESFKLTTIGGESIPGTRFDVKLDIKKPKGTILEVKPTETGWLRVRAQPSGAATEIDRISTGERFFQLKDAGNGWIKLDLGSGKSGWASIQYLKYL